MPCYGRTGSPTAADERHGGCANIELVPALLCQIDVYGLPGEEARRPAPLRAPGKRSQLVLFAPAATTDACGRHVPRAQMRRWYTGLRGSQGRKSPRGIAGRAFRLRTAAARSASRRSPRLPPLPIAPGRSDKAVTDRAALAALVKELNARR